MLAVNLGLALLLVAYAVGGLIELVGHLVSNY